MVKSTVPSNQKRRWWILSAVKPAKGWTGTTSLPLDSKSHHVNISCKKGLIAKQKECVYNKCKNDGIIGTEQAYECECYDKQQTDSNINSYECVLCLMILNYTMSMLKVLNRKVIYSWYKDR